MQGEPSGKKGNTTLGLPLNWEIQKATPIYLFSACSFYDQTTFCVNKHTNIQLIQAHFPNTSGINCVALVSGGLLYR